MLEDIKERVCAANKALAASGIVIYTWGNVSEIDPARQLVVIKPSGIRLGTPAVTARGFNTDDCDKIAEAIKLAVFDNDAEGAKTIVKGLTEKYPLY